MQRERLFRDETGAALERVAQLEAENARLREELANPVRVAPPPLQSRRRRWDASLFATLFGFLLVGGVGVFFAAMALGRHASRAEPVAVVASVEAPGFSYESALATIGLDPPGAQKLGDDALAGPLAALGPCGRPNGMRVSLRIAVRDGEAVGVSVYTTPRDPKVAGCIDREVRALAWPRTAALSTLSTAF